MKTIDEFLFDLYSLDIKLQIKNNQVIYDADDKAITPKLANEIQERQAEIIDFFNQANLAFENSDQSIEPISKDKNLPLSFAQQRLWFLEQLQPGSSVYNIPAAVRLQGLLNYNVLEKSFNEIRRRHEVLRTNFIREDGQPVQVISPFLNVKLPIVDLQNYNLVEQEAEIQRLAEKEAKTPFYLEKDCLLRLKVLVLKETESVILLTMHHIISDGWSMNILIQELAVIYKAFSQGQPSPLDDLPIQYGDFAVWQRQWLQGKRLDSHITYWKQKLGGILPILQLPTDFPRSRIQNFRGDNQTFSLSQELTKKLKILSQLENVTLFTILLAAYKVLLYRYTGQEDIIVGSPAANRNRPEIEGLIGFFVNTLVLRSHVSGQMSFSVLLAQIRETVLDAYDHQDLPFEKLVEELQPERDLSYSPLFQVKFRLENLPPEQLNLPDLTISSLKQAYSTAKLDLSLDLYETPKGIVGGFEYDKDLFKADTIKRMVGHFCTLLESLINHPERQISNLSLLTESERQQILIDWNKTTIGYSQSLCFHQLFERQVEKTPNSIALIFEDQQLTYQELNQKSNQLAHYLRKLGVKPEIKVGIYIERSLEIIIAVLGVLKAGGAYVPLDPAYPSDRIAFMLSDSQVSVLLTLEKLSPELPQNSSQILCLDTDCKLIAQESEQNPINHVTIQNLAYLIYTSGSTGIPKGVLISHEGLVNLTEDKIRVCDVDSSSCVLQFFSLSFDASIPEIIMALGSGAKLCLAKLEDLLPGPALLQLLREQAVTHITITPSALATLPVEELPDLKMVLVGGEAPSPELINNWSKGRRFINAYGPTEVTVNASMVQCGNGYPILPTIQPSANKQLYILDQYLQPVPVGILGELYISGIGLARGYLNRPDKTAQAFIPNPFYKKQNHQNTSTRLYKTGDLACYLPDGRIKLCGRIDNQVKIRGFRIEPGEIEALLNQHPQVQTSIVTVKEESLGDKHLIAYFILEPNSLIGSNELRSFLREKLPAYMIPIYFIKIDTLPLTPNGKIDYQALPEIEQARSLSRELIAPRTPTEKSLTKVFAQVLEIEQVSIYDNFFDLGGHSLLATQLIAQLLEEFQIELTVIDLFEAPNIAELAERIEKQQILEQLQTSPLENNEEREEFEI